MVQRAKVIGRLSGASTIAVALGIAGLLAAAASGPRGKVLGWSGTSAASAAVPASAADPFAALLTSGLRVIRARSIPVDIHVGAEPAPAPQVQLAARRRTSEDSEREQVPSTTWDGTPMPRETVAPAAAGQQAIPAVPSVPAAKPGTAPAATTSPAAGEGDGKAGAGAAPGATAPAPVVPEQWSSEEVAAALKECVTLLGPVDAEIEPIEATKKGACGAPAPVRLKSIGSKDKKVEFSPPIEINCQMVVKLGQWIETSLQPAAMEALSARVTKIAGASGYQCRNRYGLANAPLSEHALANAVDIPAFVLASGRQVRIVSGWGPTARDLVARAEADAKTASADEKPAEQSTSKTVSDNKGKPVPAADEKKPAAKKSKEPQKADTKTGTGKADASRSGIDQNDAAKAEPGKSDPKKKEKVAELKGAGIQKLGVPTSITSSAAMKPAVEPPAKEVTSDGRFLRKAYAGACGTFGTVLGPEANEAHRDHFHLDLKARKKLAYCQ